MRLVLDTGVVASGLLWQGPPNRLIEEAFDGRIELATSPALLVELEGILPRAKFARQIAKQSLSIAGLVLRYAELAQLVHPASIAPVVLADPDDDHVLACALAAQADLIVSGDPDLLNLKRYQSIPIVSPAEAFKRLPQR
ncbi:MAG: putative toxin-antitoxin system toxin component, PIN family [Phycisphaeraceae bacterium]